MNINYILIGLTILIIGYYVFNSSIKEPIMVKSAEDNVAKDNGNDCPSGCVKPTKTYGNCKLNPPRPPPNPKKGPRPPWNPTDLLCPWKCPDKNSNCYGIDTNCLQCKPPVRFPLPGNDSSTCSSYDNATQCNIDSKCYWNNNTSWCEDIPDQNTGGGEAQHKIPSSNNNILSGGGELQHKKSSPNNNVLSGGGELQHKKSSPNNNNVGSLTDTEIESWGKAVQSIKNLNDGTTTDEQRIAKQTLDWKKTNEKNRISSTNKSKNNGSANEKTNQAISNSISKVSGGTTGTGSNNIKSSISKDIDGTATVNISFGAPGTNITSSIQGVGSNITNNKKATEHFSGTQKYTQPVIHRSFLLRPGAFS